MKIYFLSATFLFFCLITKAQKLEIIDTTQYIGMYNYTFQQDSSNLYTVIDQNMILQIGRHCSKFSNERILFADSVLNSHKGMDASASINKMLPLIGNNVAKSLANYNIYKNYPQKDTITFTTTINSKIKFKVTQSLTFNWSIDTEKDTIIKGYHCLHANTFFAGRYYIAWFTPDIPIKDGPYKFGGLPGLIIKITDSKNQHKFELTSFKKINYLNTIYYKHEQYANVSASGFVKAFTAARAELFQKIATNNNMTPFNQESKNNALQNVQSKNNFIERY
jgi:GLPGLI family protein